MYTWWCSPNFTSILWSQWTTKKRRRKNNQCVDLNPNNTFHNVNLYKIINIGPNAMVYIYYLNRTFQSANIISLGINTSTTKMKGCRTHYLLCTIWRLKRCTKHFLFYRWFDENNMLVVYLFLFNGIVLIYQN